MSLSKTSSLCTWKFGSRYLKIIVSYELRIPWWAFFLILIYLRKREREEGEKKGKERGREKEGERNTHMPLITGPEPDQWSETKPTSPTWVPKPNYLSHHNCFPVSTLAGSWNLELQPGSETSHSYVGHLNCEAK